MCCSYSWNHLMTPLDYLGTRLGAATHRLEITTLAKSKLCICCSKHMVTHLVGNVWA